MQKYSMSFNHKRFTCIIAMAIVYPSANSVSQAAEFFGIGLPSLSASYNPIVSEDGTTISVKDEGIGMSEMHMEKLFKVMWKNFEAGKSFDHIALCDE